MIRVAFSHTGIYRAKYLIKYSKIQGARFGRNSSGSISREKQSFDSKEQYSGSGVWVFCTLYCYLHAHGQPAQQPVFVAASF